MDYLWESEEFVDDNTLNVNIKRLRTKLEELGIINQIETRRGQGYILKMKFREFIKEKDIINFTSVIYNNKFRNITIAISAN